MGNRYFYYFNLFILSITGLLLLCIPFIEENNLVNGLVTGRVGWMHICMVLLAVCVGSSLADKENYRIPYHWQDGWVIMLAGWTILGYDWKLDPEPEKLLFGGQLVILWLLLRQIFNRYPQLKMLFLSFMICMGGLEALRGIGQLYGWQASNHSLFRVTGTFFNPGPLAGYLAMVLPICLGLILRIGKCKRIEWWQGLGIIKGLAYASGVLIIVIVPSTMSRTAWVAAVAACGWVYWMERIGWKATKHWIDEHKKKAIAGSAGLLMIGLIGGMAVFHLKKDSANGRLLLWKVTAQAMGEQPVSGVGLGGFPAAYAHIQADYFSAGNASDTEKRVAGCPEYAFNEFLQIGVEEGIVGLLLFLGWIGSCLCQGIRKRRYAACGGIGALMLFAWASYPLQLPSFWVMLVFLGVIASSGSPTGNENFTRMKSRFLLGGIGIACGCISVCFALKGKPYYESYKEWNRARLFYTNKTYETALPDYTALYPCLKHKPEFLFEGAQCLSKTGKPEEAIQWLKRAVQLSADPMLYYMIAKNEQTLGQYEQAEKHLLYGLQILPERIYPYYLLAKLYGEPAFLHPEKRKAAADSVLTKEPKVQSTAIREMRKEMEKMLKSTK